LVRPKSWNDIGARTRRERGDTTLTKCRDQVNQGEKRGVLGKGLFKKLRKGRGESLQKGGMGRGKTLNSLKKKKEKLKTKWR